MLSRHHFLTATLCGIVVLGSSSLAAAQTLGPNGEDATPSSALTLTDAEVARLKEGKYSAALVWHTSSDFISAVTAGAIHEFDRAGIKVVATTDAGFDSAPTDVCCGRNRRVVVGRLSSHASRKG